MKSFLRDDPDQLYHQLTKAIEIGSSLEVSKKLVESEIVVNSQDYYVTLKRSQILHLLERNNEAIDAATKAIGLDSNHWESLMYRSLYYYSIEKFVEAKADYESAIQLFTGGDLIQYMHENALSSFDEHRYFPTYFYAAPIFPRMDYDSVLFEKMGLSLLAMKLYGYAETIFKEKLECDVDTFGRYSYEDGFPLLEVYLATDRYEEALREISSIEDWYQFSADKLPHAEIDTEDEENDDENENATWRELQYHRGYCCLKLKKYPEAAEHLTNALSGAMGIDHELFGLEGKVYRFLRVNRTDLDPVIRMKTEALMFAGKLTETIEHLSKLLEKNASDAEALYRRGVAYIQIDDKEKSQKDLLKAKALGHTAASELLADVKPAPPTTARSTEIDEMMLAKTYLETALRLNKSELTQLELGKESFIPQYTWSRNMKKVKFLKAIHQLSDTEIDTRMREKNLLIDIMLKFGDMLEKKAEFDRDESYDKTLDIDSLDSYASVREEYEKPVSDATDPLMKAVTVRLDEKATDRMDREQIINEIIRLSPRAQKKGSFNNHSTEALRRILKKAIKD